MPAATDRRTRHTDKEASSAWEWYRPYLHVVKKKFAGYVDSLDTGGIFSEMEKMYVNG
ncbi:MAG TPA: hypothetical protein VFW96_16540 [Thermomicrobiales bacterium]|nr:hypothetical protein [Thermomicrobiales bacterium]